MRGRKKLPRVIKEAQGTLQKCRDHPEPQIKEEIKDAPEWFDDEHTACWDYIIEHAPDGLLGTIDRDLLVAWVTCSVQYKECAKATMGKPLVFKDSQGNPKQHPYLNIMNKHAQTMVKLAGEMGFTPASRGRINMREPDKKEEGNPFAQLLSIQGGKQ